MKRAGLVLLSMVLVCFIVLVILFWNELRSLASIRKLDDYGMFQMTYYGDYGFDEFLLAGAENDGDIEAFVTKRLLKGLPIDFDITGGGCTVFVTRNESGEVIMGRNFDFDYSPSMQVITRPMNGYASVSTVNLSFAGYSESNLPNLIGDAGGNSVLVEYYNGQMRAVTTDEAYQIASNFIAYQGVNIGEGFTEFERYDAVKEAIDSNGGVLSEERVLSLLAEVGVLNDGEDKLEWTVVYNMSSLEGSIFANRNTDNIIEFQLEP